MGYKRIELLFQSETRTRFLHFRTVGSSILFLSAAFLVLIGSTPGDAQTADARSVRASAAFAEVKLRKTEVEADLEALSADYTEASPRIVDLKAELSALDAGAARLMRAKASDVSGLTAAVGKLLVRHAAITVEVTKLLRTYSPDHPDVVRAKRRLAVFDSAIKELLP